MYTKINTKYYNLTYPLADKGFVDFVPIVFGEERCNPLHSFGPVVRGHYLIHYVVSGKGTLYLDGKEYHIKEKQAFGKPENLFRIQSYLKTALIKILKSVQRQLPQQID